MNSPSPHYITVLPRASEAGTLVNLTLQMKYIQLLGQGSRSHRPAHQGAEVGAQEQGRSSIMRKGQASPSAPHKRGGMTGHRRLVCQPSPGALRTESP